MTNPAKHRVASSCTEPEIRPLSELTHSAIYSGLVWHSRLYPKQHSFHYHMFMVYLDIDELDAFLQVSSLWSAKPWAWSRFRRRDFHGDQALPIKTAVANTLAEQGYALNGPVRVLNNWSYFGFAMNPLSTYYCFADNGETLQYILAEVNNTPWNERHTYIFDCRTGIDDRGEKQEKSISICFDKSFSVSPFFPLNMSYHWRCSVPGESLLIDIDNFQNGIKVFSAGVRFKRQPINATVLRNTIIRFPMISVKVVAAIYWQALKLLLKGIPFLGKNKISQVVTNKS